MFTASNSTQLLIGKSISRTATVNVLDSNNSSYLADGEVVVLDQNDTPLVGGTTYPQSQYIRIVQRSSATASGEQVIFGDRIDGANVIAYSGKSYVAPQEQIWSFGFNGVSGSIDETGTDDYVLRLTFKEDKTIWSHYSNTRIWRYEPDLTNTDQEVADYFAVKISEDSFSKAEVKVERLMNVAATGTDAANYTVTNGSATVTTSAAATAVVGDYFRFPAGVTGSVYKIKSIESATSLTLDQVYQGTSGTLTTPEYILSATAATSAFGVKFTGKAQTFTVGKLKYVKVAFDFVLDGFGTTTVSKTQEAGRGNGTGQEIAELEFFTYGFEGAIDRFTDSSPGIKADASTSANYDVIAIEYFVNFDTMTVSGAKPARKLLLVALVDGAAQSTNILAGLNPWMASTPKAFANISL